MSHKLIIKNLSTKKILKVLILSLCMIRADTIRSNILPVLGCSEHPQRHNHSRFSSPFLSSRLKGRLETQLLALFCRLQSLSTDGGRTRYSGTQLWWVILEIHVTPTQKLSALPVSLMCLLHDVLMVSGFCKAFSIGYFWMFLPFTEFPLFCATTGTKISPEKHQLYN